MAITAVVTPGKVFSTNQPFDTDDLNDAANPSVQIDVGSGVAGSDIGTDTITMANLKQGAYFVATSAVYSAGLYTLVMSPVCAGIVKGQMLIFKADAANASGAVNVKLDALAAVDLLDQHGQELVAGDIQANDVIFAVAYADAGAFRIVGTLNSKQHRYATTAGTANAQTLDYGLNVPSLAAIEGLPIVAKIGVALTNTSAVTLAVDGLVATDVKLPNGGALVAGDLVAGTIAVFVYNGTNFNLLNPSSFTFYSTAGLVYQKVMTVDATGMDQASGTQLPYDNSIPGTGDGVAYAALQTAITPKSASSNLYVTVVINGIQTDTDGHFTAALFLDAEGSARAAATLYIDAPSPADSFAYGPLIITYKMASGSIAAKTFKVRVGHSGATTDWGINCQITGGANNLGGVVTSSLTVEEIG